jgi:hypothetical protein
MPNGGGELMNEEDTKMAGGGGRGTDRSDR